MIFNILIVQNTLILLSKFQVYWLFGSGEEAQNRFWRWRPAWILDLSGFNYFDLQVAPILPISFESVGLSVQETKRKEDFQDGGHDGRLGFPTETILIISSTSCIETSYQVSSQLAFQFRRRSAKTIFTKAAITYFLEFPLEQL